MSASKSILTDIGNTVSYLSSPTVKIHVGEEDTRTFFVHKDLLTSRSLFFAKALRGYQDETGTSSTNAEAIQWKEGEEGVVELPDDNPTIFDTYLQLIYHNHLPICCPISKQPALPVDTPTEEVEKAKTAFEVSEIDKTNQEFNLLAKLYVLAEKIRDVAAKRSILAAFVESTTKPRFNNKSYYPDEDSISIIYDSTVPGDPLREFLTDCHVLVGSAGWVGDTPTTYPREFLFDLVVGMYKTRRPPSDCSKIEDASAYAEKLKADE